MGKKPPKRRLRMWRTPGSLRERPKASECEAFPSERAKPRAIWRRRAPVSLVIYNGLKLSDLDSRLQPLDSSRGAWTRAGQSRGDWRSQIKCLTMSNWTLNKSTFLVFWTFLWSKVSSTVNVFQRSTNILNVPRLFPWLYEDFEKLRFDCVCDRRSNEKFNFHIVKEIFTKTIPNPKLPEF